MNGLQLLENLRAKIREINETQTHLTIIEPQFVFMSAYDSQNFIKHIKSKGIEQVYNKPISKEAFNTII